MTDLLAIGTRKGLWLARSDDDRRTWTVDGPHLLAQEVAAVGVDTPPRPSAACSPAIHVRPLGPDGHVVRRPRRARGRRPTTAPSGSRRTPAPRSPASGSCAPTRADRPDVVWAGCEPHSLWRSDRRRRAASSWSAGCGTTRTGRPGSPGRGRRRAHGAARPGVRPGHRRHEHRRRLRQRGRRRVLEPRNRGISAAVHARPTARVRPVRAQGRRRRGRPEPDVRAEPRRRLPDRRRRRLLDTPSPAVCRPTSASRSSPRRDARAPPGWCRSSPTCSASRRTAGCACTAPATRARPGPRSAPGLPDGAWTAVLRDAFCADDQRPDRHLRRHPRRLRLRQRRRGRDLRPSSPTTCPTSSIRPGGRRVPVSVEVVLPGVLADLAGGDKHVDVEVGRGPEPGRRVLDVLADGPSAARPADPRRDRGSCGGSSTSTSTATTCASTRGSRRRCGDGAGRAGAAVGRRRLTPGRQRAASSAQAAQSCCSS